MRDPRRIDTVLELVRAYWQRYPDLRLGQVMVNLTPVNLDTFYLEDDHLTDIICKKLVDENG